MKINYRALFVGAIAGIVSFVLFSFQFSAKPNTGPSVLLPVGNGNEPEGQDVPQVKEDQPQSDELHGAVGQPADSGDHEDDKVNPPQQVVERQATCLGMVSTYDLKTWGDLSTLPLSAQAEWASNRCGQLSGLPLSAALPQDTELASSCEELMEKYQPQPGRSWGQMQSIALRYRWSSLSCDQWYWDSVVAATTFAACPPTNRDAVELIAIMAGSTSRTVVNPSTDNMALFRWLLPSVVRTVECGFRYMFVLGYDIDDAYFDSPEGVKEVTKWFEDHVQAPLDKSNIVMDFVPVRFKNTQRKPGPVFLAMAQRAYREGADYFYRVNDDTQLIHRWPKTFVEALKSLGEPYGVVGPVCHEGNPKILTHDFTHRTHMDIFRMEYYPPELSDWWMDDWISSVYGSERTIQPTAVQAIHRTGTHGQRYQVDRSHQRLLAGLVQKGRATIRNYMVQSGVSEAVLESFDSDKKSGAPYKDFTLG